MNEQESFLFNYQIRVNADHFLREIGYREVLFNPFKISLGKIEELVLRKPSIGTDVKMHCTPLPLIGTYLF